MKRENKKHDPLFLSVREVCRILQIKPHILDYWEKRFPEIKPHKIAKRNFYKKEQLKLLYQIKRLLEEGYSLDGIRKKILTQERPSSETREEGLSLFPEFEIKKRYSHKKPSEIPKKEEKWRKIIREVLSELKAIYRSL
ncbi:MAG: MerR family transcriptional regulator [Caldimicrobium sp.]|nr:MerR family transcriptional regulator [Caldimicrobium sp.]MCX7613195.1 MerR family transcriptional regulator [Caldimicrobium sp.]MDW8182503.1 MerR family transcriptional regulator [Caldimicrobium sp.]